jgi:hypothetical protein
MSFILVLIAVSSATEQGDPHVLLPRLRDYAEPESSGALLAWAQPGETITAWVGGDEGCQPVPLDRTERALVGRTAACPLELGQETPSPLSCDLVLADRARTEACTLAGQPFEPHEALDLALVMADDGAAWFAPAVALKVECPRVERLQRCLDGSGRVCSSSPGCHLIELGAGQDEQAREATMGSSQPVDCGRPCPEGLHDPEGTAAWLNGLVAERPAVPLDATRGYAIYASRERCEAESGWGSSLLELPGCAWDRLAANAELALDRCVRTKKKDAGSTLELRLLVGPSGKLLAVDLVIESPRAETWSRCVEEELGELELGASPEGQAWSYITERVLTLPEGSP